MRISLPLAGVKWPPVVWPFENVLRRRRQQPVCVVTGRQLGGRGDQLPAVRRAKGKAGWERLVGQTPQGLHVRNSPSWAKLEVQGHECGRPST